MIAVAPPSLPTRPPMPECPGFERHHFAGSVRCRRPECRRPLRHWRDYDLRESGLELDLQVKVWLYDWLRGTLTDNGLKIQVGQKFGNHFQAEAALAAWKRVRDGDDLHDRADVSLWRDQGGRLLLRTDVRPGWVYVEPTPAVFETDAATMIDLARPAPGRPLQVEPGQFLPSPVSVIAVWTLEGGPRLATTVDLDRTICTYLGLAYPVEWMSTGQAGELLGYGRSNVTHLVRAGFLHTRKPGRDHLVDPLHAQWRLTQRRYRFKSETD